MNGAVSAAGEDGVAPRENSLLRFFFSVAAGVGEDEIGFDSSIAQKSEDGLQLGLALATAAGIGIVEQGCLAHRLVEDGLYLERFFSKHTLQAARVWNKLWLLGKGASPVTLLRPPSRNSNSGGSTR